MNKELIDKCLDFAEGKKGKFTILMVKKPEFPDNLIEGTEKQREINGYVELGLPTRQIAEKLGCSQPTVVEHMRQYKKSVAFHREWCEFWEFSADVRQTPIGAAFNDILADAEIEEYRSKGVEMVGDFLRLSVTMRTTRLYNMLSGLDARKMAALFGCIRELCYSSLD